MTVTTVVPHSALRIKGFFGFDAAPRLATFVITVLVKLLRLRATLPSVSVLVAFTTLPTIAPRSMSKIHGESGQRD